MRYLLLISVILLISLISLVIYKNRPSEPLTWEKCLASPKAIVTTSYPGTCQLPDGRSATQPLLPENNIPDDFACPQNGWVDCMPILEEAKQKACSDDAVTWYRQNCPNFEGLAM